MTNLRSNKQFRCPKGNHAYDKQNAAQASVGLGSPLTEQRLVHIGAALESHDDQVRSVHYSAEGRWLLTSSFDGRACEWLSVHIKIPACIATQTAPVPATCLRSALRWCVAVSTTLCGRRSAPIGVVDIPQSLLAARLSGHSEKVVRACWHPHNLWVVSGGTDRKVILWKP